MFKKIKQGSLKSPTYTRTPPSHLPTPESLKSPTYTRTPQPTYVLTYLLTNQHPNSPKSPNYPQTPLTLFPYWPEGFLGAELPALVVDVLEGNLGRVSFFVLEFCGGARVPVASTPPAVVVPGFVVDAAHGVTVLSRRHSVVTTSRFRF